LISGGVAHQDRA